MVLATLVKPVSRRPSFRAILLLLVPLAAACGPTEVLVGDAPGVARVVAGTLGARAHVSVIADNPPTGDALTIAIGIPEGVAAEPDGSFFFADALRRRIGHVSADGQLTWPIGRGTCGFPGPGGTDPAGVCLAAPGGLALAPDGSLVFADPKADYVYRVSANLKRATVLLGTGTPGIAASGAVGNRSPTNRPTAVAIGPDGLVYVAEANNHRVVRIDSSGTIAVVAGNGTQGDSGDGGPAAKARLSLPQGLAWMGDTLYIADTGNERIRRVIHDSLFPYAGVGAAGFAGDGKAATEALFRQPTWMAVQGTLLFVADQGNQRIRVIRVGPDSILTYGGTGAAESGPDFLEIARTGLAGPAGLAAAGRAVFIADSGGAVIRRVIR